MRSLSTRWIFRGKLKLILVLLFTFSLLFMSYQIIYYASLNQYQSDESEAQLRHKLIHSESETKHVIETKLEEPPRRDIQSQNEKQIYPQSQSQVKAPPAPAPFVGKKGELSYRGGKPVGSGILGVAPEYWQRYTSPSQKFTCFISKVRIGWEYVNDDYCDCPGDGSDEPSTSACMNGKFYCTKSTQAYPEYVPSSRVNDGICDCKDCSEEYNNQIRSKILLSGPITVAEYMKMALTTQQQSVALNSSGKADGGGGLGLGYYMGKDVFGQQGDFITSPEISQLFGEMVGVWGVETWLRIGGPSKFSIVELGPGRGTLAKDVLRVFRQLNRVTGKDISFHLVEISPFLARTQAQTLCGPTSSLGLSNLTFNRSLRDIDPTREGSGGNTFYHQGITSETDVPVYWYRDLASLPRGFHFYIAHEFFDALPVHKLQRVDNKWREVLVDLDPKILQRPAVIRPDSAANLEHNRSSKEEENLRFVISRHETPAISLLRNYYQKILLDSRNHIEVSLEAVQIYEELTNRLERDGGMSLIIDYGHEGTKEDTFRAFRRHTLHDPLANPGTADLTADVDFSMIRKICEEKSLTCGPITQRQLLSRVGIDLRLKKLLARSKGEEEREQLRSGYKMLMEEMGERFKCLALFPKVLEDFRPALKIAAFDEPDKH